MTPLFSFVVIARNEEKTLPKLLDSLREFRARGGEVVILDTGSTDHTADVARGYGCNVHEVGDRFLVRIADEDAAAANALLEDGDEPVLKAGDTLFNFSAARNYAAGLALNDMISMPDADEIYTRLDLDAVNGAIAGGAEQLEYNFVFSHDASGNEAIKFLHSKFYSRRKMRWSGIIHEVLVGEVKRVFLPETIVKLEHWQNPETNRAGYLRGLALDCSQNPTDRNRHYFARELLWAGRPRSAIKQFERHIAMNCWLAERAQSMSFIGDAWGKLNQPGLQVEAYARAFYMDSSRREPLINLARFHQHNNNPQGAACYASAALEIAWNGFYANQMAHYTNEPHEILYWARGWLGDVPGAQKHILEALKHQPYNPQYLRDTKFYFAYPDNGIEGWMTFPELTWLYETAKTMGTIAEIGSWKGRSTHALLSAGAVVTAIDHWKGSADPGDLTHGAKGIYEQFGANVGHFPNLTIKRMSGAEAAQDDERYDMVFIDAGHTYEEVVADIRAWKHKARVLLCGHDYTITWLGVQRAVNDELGEVGVCDTIWFKRMAEPQAVVADLPRVAILVPTLRPAGLARLQASIGRLDYPKDLLEVAVLPDSPRLGVPIRVAEGVAMTTAPLIVFAADDMEFSPRSLRMAVEAAARADLVAFNAGALLPDDGNICEHFLIRREFLPKIGGKIFDTDFHHVGVDNLLWAKAKKAGRAVRCEQATVTHHHFSRGGEMDEVYELGWRRHEADRAMLRRKLAELEGIPKRIFAIWLGSDPPELVRRCLKTQAVPGYEWRLVTDADGCESPYLATALKAKKWVKAADYLRVFLLWRDGGIHLDADVEVLPGRNFDDLLSAKLFAGRENNRYINSAVAGAVTGHPALKRCLDRIEREFAGDDDLGFQSSLQIFTETLYAAPPAEGVRILPPDWFTPYDHQANTVAYSSNTRVYHHFMKSWK